MRTYNSINNKLLFLYLWLLLSCLLSSHHKVVEANGTRGGVGSQQQPRHNKYEESWWADLPDEAKDAARVLGFDSYWWDMGGATWVTLKFWRELTKEQRAAAEVLGWSRKTWDATEWEGFYSDHDWAELPRLARRAAAALGHSERTWDNDIVTEAEEKCWLELTDSERMAAGFFGYNYLLWDDDSEPGECSYASTILEAAQQLTVGDIEDKEERGDGE